VNPNGLATMEKGHATRRVHALLIPVPDGRLARAAARRTRSHVVLPVVTELVSVIVVASLVFFALGVLLTHVLEHGFIGAWDHHVIAWLVKHRTSLGNRVSGDLTWMADTITVCAVALVMTAVLFVRRWGRQSLVIAAGLVVELAVFLSVNSLVARPRPGVAHLGGTPSTYSFPSGHTAAAIVLYGSLAVIVTAATDRVAPRMIAWILAALVTIAVALSRVYRGEHYPSDVIGGALLGVVALTSAVFAIRIASAYLRASGQGAAPRQDVDSTPRELGVGA